MSELGKWIENIGSSCRPESLRASIKFRGINLLRCKAYTPDSETVGGGWRPIFFWEKL